MVVWICGFNRWTEIVAAVDAMFVQVASIDGMQLRVEPVRQPDNSNPP